MRNTTNAKCRMRNTTNAKCGMRNAEYPGYAPWVNTPYQSSGASVQWRLWNNRRAALEWWFVFKFRCACRRRRRCSVLAGMARTESALNKKWKMDIMKVIIRDMETGLYLKGPARWGDTQSEAMAFENSIAALEFCVAQKVHNVEILLLIGEPTDRPLRLFPRPTVGTAIPAPGREQASALAHV